MKLFVVICLVLTSSAVAGMAHSREANPVDLKQYRWQNRLLLIFAPVADHPAYRPLADALRGQPDEVRDRDLLVFSLLEQGQSRLGDVRLDKVAVAALTKRFAVKPGAFSVILIGKDGGEKLRRAEGVTLWEIFGRIDAMPMRRQEMREKTGR